VSASLFALALAAASGAADRAPTFRQLIEMTDISSVAVSPDGKEVVYRAETGSLANNNYRLDWYVVPTDGSAPPRRFADAGEGEWPNGMIYSEPPVWARDSSAVLYRRISNGEVQVWRAPIAGGDPEKITTDPANIENFALSKDGRTLVYAVGATRAEIARAEEAEYDTGVLIDSKVDPLRQLYRGWRIEGRLATDRLHGGGFMHGGVLADRPLSYRSIDLATRAPRAATTSEIGLLQRPEEVFAKLGDHMIKDKAASGDWRGDAYVLGDGLRRILEVHRPDGKVISCSAPLCNLNISRVTWQGNADSLLLTTTDIAANQTLYLWSIATGKVRGIAGGVGRWNGGRDEQQSCAVDLKAAYCVMAAADTPPRLVRVDLATGNLRTLANPDQYLEQSEFQKFTPLEWTAADGRRFAGQLMVPSHRNGPAPLFVTYYVCDGYLRGGTADEYPLRQLAASGIAVLCINRAPTVVGPGDQVAEYRIAQAGITAAIDLLVTHGIADPHRVGMGGMSFGGEVTMWMATRTSRLAALSVANVLFSHTYYWLGAMAGREVPDMLRKVWGLGTQEETPERWKLIAPELMTDAIHAPLLMQLPESEFRSNVELAARLSRKGKAVELRAFPYETHVKYQPRHKLAIYQRNLDWFRFWLQGYVDPDPAKADQYRRWNAMKKTASR